MSDLSGTNIKGYELQERIGAGGFGAVYRAQQTTVGRDVAIKIILPGFANHPDFIRRFETEAQLIARLEHLHITPLYDYWRDPSGAYIVMRYFRGGSLREAIREQPYNPKSAVQLIDQVASALALAHRNDIVHRDLKPGNILLDEDGNAYLADFGIAKILHDLEPGLIKSEVIGSLDYISPEQARSEPVSAQTDIYSFGVVLYEMLVGEHPFPNCSSVERLYKHINEPLPELANLGENGIQAQVNAVIQKATAKNPAQRYADVLEMAAAFREAVGLVALPPGDETIETLTLREQEVLRCLIDGCSNREIANQLVITLGTVKWYIRQIYRKLGVRSRVQAIVRARELDLVSPRTISDEHVAISAESTVSLRLLEPENPYRGLRPFQAADQRFFFGREKLIEKLISHLAAGVKTSPHRFLAVVGPSGSGKSSLIKAGLIPALWRGAIPGSERWFMVEMVPGLHPLDELEIALLKVAANQVHNLREQLTRDERGLVRIAQLILPDDGSELVVVIDQFEELFTLTDDEAARLAFMNLLSRAVTDPRSRVRLVITLRADFYDRPLRYPGFGELVRSHMETILPLSADELERAILRPAQLVGVTFEKGLAASIIEDVHYQPGALPLLQYALTELFGQRAGRLITREAYQQIGGTVGALARRANEIYVNQTAEGQETIRQMFLRLVTLGASAEATRRRTKRSELLAVAGDVDLMDELIDAYADYRLLLLDHDPISRSPMVELAHEAMIDEWQLLQSWLDESRDDIRMQRLLGAAAQEWLVAIKDPSYLLRGSRLDQFALWAENTNLALTTDEQAYLNASLENRREREAAEAERQAHETQLENSSRRFLRALVVVFALAAVIAILLSGVAFNQSNIAQNNARLANQNAATATFAQGEALVLADSRATQQAIAEEQAAARATQQAIAEEEAAARALAEAQALADRDRALVAEQEALKQASIGLASIALQELQTANSERGVLLALAALEEYPYTPQAEAALGRAVQESLPYKILSDPKGWNLDGHWVDWSPDGKRIAVGRAPNLDGERSAIIYDLASGEIVLVLPLVFETQITTNGLCSVQQINWSPDGIRLALVANNNNLDTPQPSCYRFQIYDAAAGYLLLDLDSQGEFAVDWSPDGKRLLTGGEGGRVRIWDAGNGDILLEMPGHAQTGFEIFPNTSDRVLAARFSPDGQSVATFSVGGIVHIWDANTGELLHTFVHPPEIIQKPLVYPGMNKIGLTWSPDGRYLATAWYDGLGRIWNVETGQVQKILSGHTSNLIGIDWSPDGNYILTQGVDSSARLWAASTGQLILTLPTNGFGNAAWSSDGSWMAVPTQEGLLAWDISVLPPILNPGEPLQYPLHIAMWSPDGRSLVISGRDGLVFDWPGNLSSRKISPNAGFIAISPDSTRLISTRGKDQKVPQIIDLASGKVIMELQNPDPDFLYFTNSWSHDGKKVASGTYPGFWTVIWDPETGEEITRSETVGGFMNQAQFSPDDTILAAPAVFAEGGSPVYLIDTTTGETLRELPSEDGWSCVAMWSPDGKTLAVGYQDGTIKLWNTETWKVVTEFKAHQGMVWDLDWSPNGQRIISGDADNSVIYIWDVETGDIILSWNMQGLLEGGFDDLDWSPDGQYVAIHGTSGMPFIKRTWQTTGDLIAYAYECCVWRELTPEERMQFGLPEKP